MNKLYNELPMDEVMEDERIYTVGDSLLNQFYNGNWSDSVQEMVDNNISTNDLLQYIETHMDGEGS